MINDEKKITLFLVDDDALYLKMLEIEMLQHDEFEIETFATGELCLAALERKPDVVILDYHLDGIDKTAMNGLETLDKVLEFDSSIPVIMLSSQDKIEVAVNCMHHRATDYVVKSETAYLRLHKIIVAHFQFKKLEQAANWYKNRM